MYFCLMISFIVMFFVWYDLCVILIGFIGDNKVCEYMYLFLYNVLYTLCFVNKIKGK